MNLFFRYPPLVTQLKDLVKHLHSPPLWNDADLVVTPGSQDGLCKVIEMIMNPNDPIAIQTPCYTGTLAIVSKPLPYSYKHYINIPLQLNPYSPKYLEIEGDDKGIIPDSLRSTLYSWNKENSNKPKVKLNFIMLWVLIKKILL